MVGYQENNCFTALGSQEWQDIYEDKETEQTEGFKVGAGLNQRSAMSPFFLASVMDKLKDGVKQESPSAVMFTSVIVMCSESRKQFKEGLER